MSLDKWMDSKQKQVKRGSKTKPPVKNEINKEKGMPTNVTFYENGYFYGEYWPLGETWELEDGKILMSYKGEVYGTYYYEFIDNNTTVLTLTNAKSNASMTFEKE